MQVQKNLPIGVLKDNTLEIFNKFNGTHSQQSVFLLKKTPFSWEFYENCRAPLTLSSKSGKNDSIREVFLNFWKPSDQPLCKKSCNGCVLMIQISKLELHYNGDLPEQNKLLKKKIRQ